MQQEYAESILLLRIFLSKSLVKIIEFHSCKNFLSCFGAPMQADITIAVIVWLLYYTVQHKHIRMMWAV